MFDTTGGLDVTSPAHHRFGLVLSLCGIHACGTADKPVSRTHQRIDRCDDADGSVPDATASTQTLLTTLRERADGRPERAFAVATQDELSAIARESDTRSADARGTNLERLLATTRHAPIGPDDSQIVALRAMASHSFESLTFAWSPAAESPRWLRGIGIAVRGHDARESWHRYVRLERGSLQALYGSSLLNDAVVLHVAQRGDDDVLTVGRMLVGVPVEGDALRVTISRETSRVGAGVVRRIEGRWRRRTLAAPADVPSRWLSAVDAETRARMPGSGSRATLRMRCGETCVPVWTVWGTHGRMTEIDGLRGDVLAVRDVRNNIGPLLQGTRLPSSSFNLTTARLRGAEITDANGAIVAWTDMSTGEHTETTSAPRFIDITGPRPPGIWPLGRVDFRPGDDDTRIWSWPVPWTPASQPSRDFSSPDAWPPNGAAQHTSSLVFGWLNYWQNLTRNVVYGETVDTLSVVWLVPSPDVFGAGSSSNANVGPPGSGQSSWGRINASFNASDTVTDAVAAQQFPVFAHEFGHTIMGCAAAAGTECYDHDPNNDDRRTVNAADWRGAVHGAAVENAADAMSGLLARWPVTMIAEPWDPAWTYATYNDPNDSFGTLTQFPGTLVDCTQSGNGCSSGFRCMTNTIYPAVAPPSGQSIRTVGICVKVVSQASDCPPEFVFTQPSTMMSDPVITPPLSPGMGYCMYDDYRNRIFTQLAARFDLTLGWLNATRSLLWAAEGNHDNGERDLVEGADNWHDHITNVLGNGRFETSRAMRSIYTGPNYVARDDHPDFFSHAIPLPVISTTPVKLWWGNGQYAYPRLEDLYDTDVFLFRGVAGSRYRVETWARSGSAAIPWVSIHRWDPSFTHIANSYPSGTLSDSGALPADDWYVVAVWNGSTLGGDWEGNIRIVTDNDDFSDNAAEGYPLVRGISQSATRTPGDTADGFRVRLTTAMSNFNVSVSGAPGTVIQLDRPDGTWAAFGVDNLAQAIIDQVGAWRITVFPPASASSYSIVATHDCPIETPYCDVTSAPVNAEHPWGDLFGGRLPLPSSQRRFRVVGLADDDEVSVSVVDSDPACRLRVRVYGPSILGYFGGASIMSWTDGAMFSDLSGYSPPGPGGHFSAMRGGAWTVTVDNDPNTPGGAVPCPYFHVMLARGHRLTSMPAW